VQTKVVVFHKALLQVRQLRSVEDEWHISWADVWSAGHGSLFQCQPACPGGGYPTKHAMYYHSHQSTRPLRNHVSCLPLPGTSE
jgi:hypothetical protein